MAPLDKQQQRHQQHMALSPAPSLDHTATTKDVSPPPSPLHCGSDVSSLDSIPDSPRKFLAPPLIQYETTGSLKKHNSPESNPLAAAPQRILGAFGLLLAPPYLLYRSFPHDTVLDNFLWVVQTWNAFLRFSCYPVFAFSVCVGVYYAPWILDKRQYCALDPAQPSCGGTDQQFARRVQFLCGISPQGFQTCLKRFRCFISTVEGCAFVLSIIVFTPLAIIGSFPMVSPSWAWYPFGWAPNTFRIYQTTELAPALQGICLDQPIQAIHLPKRSWAPSFLQSEPSPEERQHLPLCLTEDSWDTLSAGALSSYNVPDVKAVLKGVDYARFHSGGMAIAVLARDIKDSLKSFRENVEGLQPFFPNLSVVFFENDSTDGSRQAIKDWAASAQGYTVDLMECAESEDCKLSKPHRDDIVKADFSQSKAVGDMDVYRQRVTDYITDSPIYKDYSHMMVIDIDLAVSLSPFGILHSLGVHPENAIAASGRQLFAFSQGTLMPPYDMSAFKPWATPENHNMLTWHESWCALKPVGDRWRNACATTSSFLMAEMLRHDAGLVDVDNYGFYQVESAFNGAVLYPIKEIRDTQASYDSGGDGQRCEHVGFNLFVGSKKPMYVNRKWDSHNDPANPGGPSGWRAQNVVKYVSSCFTLVFPLVAMNAFAYLFLMHAAITFGVFLVFPLLTPLLSGSKTLSRIISSHHFSNKKRRRIQQGASEEEAIFKLV